MRKIDVKRNKKHVLWAQRKQNRRDRVLRYAQNTVRSHREMHNAPLRLFPWLGWSLQPVQGRQDSRLERICSSISRPVALKPSALIERLASREEPRHMTVVLTNY